MAIALNTVIVDGQEYKPGDVIPDFKSIKCVDTREPRKYQGLSADVSVLNDVIAKYASGGASCFMSDTGEYYEYDREEKTWKLITNITERGFDSEKAYGALKHMLKNVSVSDEKIQSAVTDYLTVNPVLPGATTEQAQQIEQNKTDVASLKEEAGSIKEEKVDKPSTSDDGKIPRAKEGEVEWVEVGQPTDGQTENAVTKWLDKHPEATTTVKERSITENKLNEDLILNRMPVKKIFSKDVTLSSGRFNYENCNVNDITVEAVLYGNHIFKDCIIGTLFIEGGHYEFINCTFDYIKIVNSTAVFKGCKGNSIYLTGNCDNSIIDFCELTAKNHGTIVINGGISNNVKISNNKIINNQSTILSGIELQCINTHGVSNSIIENNYCETDTNRISIDISGNSEDESIRSFNNVIRNNYIVNGNIAIYATKNVIVTGNFIDGNININGEYIDGADYGYACIKNNTVSNTITVRSQSGNPIQKILVDGNIILGERGITCNYAYPETMEVYLLGNTFNGDAVLSNEYSKKIKLPTEMVYIKGNESIYIPKCYIIKSELPEQLPGDSFFNGGIVTNNRKDNRYIIYSKVNIFNGQKRLWTQ